MLVFPHVLPFLVWCWCCIFHNMFSSASAFLIKSFPPFTRIINALPQSPSITNPYTRILTWAPDARTCNVPPSVPTYSLNWSRQEMQRSSMSGKHFAHMVLSLRYCPLRYYRVPFSELPVNVFQRRWQCMSEDYERPVPARLA